MIKLNEYFDGKVKSLGAESSQGRFTAGIMVPGEYVFKTDQEEHITVTLGDLHIRLPQKEWEKISKGETLVVPAGISFDLRIDETASYICFYR